MDLDIWNRQYSSHRGIGTLLDVRQSTVNPDTCFISIAYDESTYDNVAIGSVRETYLIQEKRDRAVRKIFALLAGTESQIVGNRPRKKIGCLRNHADPPPQFLWRDLQIVSSFQINRSHRGLIEAVQETEE